MAGKLSPTDLTPGGVSVTAVPGSSADKPNFPQSLASTAPATADAANWGDNVVPASGPRPLPSDFMAPVVLGQPK